MSQSHFGRDLKCPPMAIDRMLDAVHPTNFDPSVDACRFADERLDAIHNALSVGEHFAIFDQTHERHAGRIDSEQFESDFRETRWT